MTRIMDLTAATTLANGDYFPFHPDGVELDKRVSWANIKASLTAFPLLDGSRAFTGAQTFSAGIVTGTVRPPSNSTTAFRVQDAEGNSDIVTVNSTDGTVSIGSNATQTGKFLIRTESLYQPTLNISANILEVAGSVVSFTTGVDTDAPYAFWMQARANTTSGLPFPILINPVGGNVGIGTRNPQSLLDVAGTVRADGLRLDLTPTAETPTATHTITFSANGTNYKLLCLAA